PPSSAPAGSRRAAAAPTWSSPRRRAPTPTPPSASSPTEESIDHRSSCTGIAWLITHFASDRSCIYNFLSILIRSC
uniref:Uncharacterized protein n=1 Tax=Oryza brachyantha TaxID=4533 RepID=J3MNY1_ORYBR